MKTQKLTAVIMIGGMALGAAPAFANDNQDAPFKVFVAYADKGVHASNFLPSPWVGSPGVIFIGNHGSTGPYDAGAIRIHNSSTTDKLQVNGVEVDFYTAPLGPPGVASVLFINPWYGGGAVVPAGPSFPVGGVAIPPRGDLILTQTADFNFDTSDVPVGVVGCTNDGIFPVVHVSFGIQSATQQFVDRPQTLNTGGIDPANCGGASEGRNWVDITDINN
jgi:hypothetical protein